MNLKKEGTKILKNLISKNKMNYKKRGTENEYSHNGIMNFEKIDTIWISTLYNDIIIPIDTVTKTTEKIPLPF